MAGTTLSVIIPVYNGRVFIANAIASALRQTVPPDEILVVDDGSKDDTAAFVQEEFGGHIRLIRQQNAGPAAARNRGIREATGKWLAFLDADDTWLPQKLARQLPFAANPDVGVITSIVTYQGPAGLPAPPARLLKAAHPVEAAPGLCAAPVTFDDLWLRNCIGMSSAVCRREVFEQCGGFDEDPALIGVEDYNFWLKVSASAWQILRVSENLCSYAPGPQSLTGQVERFARAEMANLEKISRTLRLPRELIESKRLRILGKYGRELFYERQLVAARGYLAGFLKANPSPSALFWWLATFLPRPLLDVKRWLLSAS